MKTIKNTFLILCLITLLLISCNSEDDSGTPLPQTTDKIELTLTSSKATYQNASTSDWIPITDVEYNLLANVLNSVSKIGTTDTQYNDVNNIIPVGSGNGGITMVNDNQVTMPINSYFFAFRYNVTEDNVSSTKVKISNTNATDGYNDLGNILPSHNNGENYFVLKGNNSPTTDAGHLAVFCLEKMGYKVTSNPTDYFFSFDDSNTLETKGITQNAIILFQGLSTTEKQWD